MNTDPREQLTTAQREAVYLCVKGPASAKAIAEHCKVPVVRAARWLKSPRFLLAVEAEREGQRQVYARLEEAIASFVNRVVLDPVPERTTEEPTIEGGDS